MHVGSMAAAHERISRRVTSVETTCSRQRGGLALTLGVSLAPFGRSDANSDTKLLSAMHHSLSATKKHVDMCLPF
jgi:hypothetical protein